MPLKNYQRSYQKLVAQRLSPDFSSAVAVVEAPLPVPAPNQLLIRNRFAGVNAGFDTLLCRGDVPTVSSAPPFDLGGEAVGIVEAVGPEVSGFKVGDPVATLERGHGYRSYQVIQENLAIKIRAATPETLALLSAGIPALVGLEKAGDMSTEETVLITDASGGIGHVAVQLAKLAGNYVIGTCGSPASAQLLQQLGCDRIINYRNESVQEVLRIECPEGINLVFDCVGKRMFDTGIENLAVRGRFVVEGFLTEYGDQLESTLRPRIYQKLFWKSASVRGFWLPSYAEYIPAARDRLLNMFYNNLLDIKVDAKVFRGIDSIPRAVSYLLSGLNAGKVVVEY